MFGEETLPVHRTARVAGKSSAAACSLALHVVFLFALTVVVVPQLASSAFNVDLEARILLDTEPEDVEVVIPSGSSFESESPGAGQVQEGYDAATAVNAPLNMSKPVMPTVNSLKGPPPSALALNYDIEQMMQRVPVSMLPIYDNVGSVRLSETETVGDVTEDIAEELKQIAEDGDAIVVWVLDRSLSMFQDRSQLAGGILPFLQEIEQDKTTRMLHIVQSFSIKSQWLTPPTRSAKRIAAAIRNIQPDESGVENTFQAIEDAAYRIQSNPKWGKSQKLIILWTDESGDDHAQLEVSARICRQLGVRVDVIGPSAVLGSQVGYTAYRHPGNGVVYNVQVTRGPDSLFAPKLALGRKESKGYTRENPATLARLRSGLGPYALTRLTAQTGGRYIIYDRASDRSPYSFKRMSGDYCPEYQSPAEIQASLMKQPLRRIVLAATAATYRRSTSLELQLQFGGRYPTFQSWQPGLQFQTLLKPRVEQAIRSVESDLAVIEEALAVYERAKVTEEFVPVEEPTVNGQAKKPADVGSAWKTISLSLLEQAYNQEQSRRWRAWCDLNFATLLYQSVRLNEYREIMLRLLRGPIRLNTDTNAIRIVESPLLLGGDVAKQRADDARKLLQRCIDQNKDTPWQFMAEQLLARFPVQSYRVRQQVIPQPPFVPGRLPVPPNQTKQTVPQFRPPKL